MKGFFILLALVATPSQVTALPNKENIDSVISSLIEAINGRRTHIRTTNQAEDLKKNEGGQDLPFIGGFLRTSFHDCLGEGGCDGCLNVDHPANNGTKEAADVLNKLYDDNNGFGMSRADFYALAGWTAVQIAPLRKTATGFLELAKQNGIEFKFGRVDCSTSPDEDEDEDPNEFPSSCFNMEDSVEFFAEKFGFTSEQTVAIMGAHTLGFMRHGLPKGRATEWVTGGGCSSRMNSKLYLQMLDGRLRPGKKEGEDGLCFWHRGVGAFLDSDLSLAYKFTRNADGSVTCGDHTFTPGVRKDADLEEYCEKADGYQQIADYREKKDQFVLDFAKAYSKLLDRGSDNLVAIDHDLPTHAFNRRAPRPTRAPGTNTGSTGNRRRQRRRRQGDTPIKRNNKVDIEQMLDDIEEEVKDLRNEIV